jgi:hypothetical protein
MASTIENVIHAMLDTQKKFYNDIEKLKQQKFDYSDIISYNELTTSSLDDGIFRKETNEVKTTKNGKSYYIVTRTLNNKIHKISFYHDDNGEKIEKEEHINCTMEEFSDMWYKNL